MITSMIFSFIFRFYLCIIANTTISALKYVVVYELNEAIIIGLRFQNLKEGEDKTWTMYFY